MIPEPRQPDRRTSSPVAFDGDRSALVLGHLTRPVADPSDSAEVYPAYLALLRAVRGAERGEVLPLRSSDVEALIALVGDDAVTVERRLVALMGCTEGEAHLLGRVLVRHRVLAGAAGLATALSLVALPVGAAAPPPAAGEVAALQDALPPRGFWPFLEPEDGEAA